MRGIEFRGKIKSDDPVISQRWAYGDYCQVGGKHFIIPDDAEVEVLGASEPAIIGLIEVTPETVGRYIGYKDNNEKKIYVGDNILYNKSFEGALSKRLSGILALWKI